MPSSPTNVSSPWNHVFVDFENVHEMDFAALGDKPVTYTLLVGASQTRLDTDLVKELMKHAGSVELIRLTSSGKNALDFALAYYVGRAAVVDPKGHFHIVSKDQGFDPLIEHLKSRRLRAYRHDDFGSLRFTGLPRAAAAPAKRAANAPTSTPSPVRLPEVLMERALAHLKKNPKNRPKREKKLGSCLQNLFGKMAAEQETQDLTSELKRKGHFRVTDKGAVSYHLPTGCGV